MIQERLSKQDLGNLPQEESIFAFWLTWGRWRRRSGTSRIPRRLFQTAQSPARNPSLWREPEPQDGKRRGGALSTAAVAAAESSGSLTGSQAPDPWASPRISSGVDRGAILGATNVWGEIGHLPVPVPSSSGERGRQGPIQQGARNRGESSVCGTCEHQQQQQQPYPRVHTCGDGDRARHKSILNEGKQFCSCFIPYDQCCARACVHPNHRPVESVLGIGDGWARCRRNAVDGKSPSHWREACTLPHPPGPVHHRGRALRLWSPQLLLLRPLHRHLELLWQVWSALVSLGRCSSALREPSLWRGNRRATLRNPEAPNCTANQAPDK